MSREYPAERQKQGKQGISISFEFFPPNTREGLIKLSDICDALNRFRPQYFSVTFGAGGGNRTKTFRTVRLLLSKNLRVAPHLTCVGLPKPVIRHMLKNYIRQGIRRIVALRGDLPETEVHRGDFYYANELVDFIRTETGSHFHIDVAAHPEFHPQAINVFAGLENFKRKIAAGADRAITQYFFNPDAYFRFLDNCHQYGITVPIVPGIMPISHFEKLLRFSRLCGAEIPTWLFKRLEAYRDDEVSLRAYGIDVVTRLCEDLLRGGAPGLHFYTLNQLSPTQHIINQLERCLVHC